MIRINLIGRKVKPKKSHGSYQFLVYLALLGAAFVVVFLWRQNVNDELESTRKKAKDAAEKVDNLMRVKQLWEAWQVEKADLDRQTGVFNALQADQIGPSMALQYLSYALTRLPDDASAGEEAREQELAGWNPKWDPKRIWLKSFEIKNGKVEMRGEAIDHEDVAEFYRRLETSEMFKNISPGLQKRKVHDDLQIKYIEFEVSANVAFGPAALAWRSAEELAARQAAEGQPAKGDEAAAVEGDAEKKADAPTEPGAGAAAGAGDAAPAPAAAVQAPAPASAVQAAAPAPAATEPANKGSQNE